MDYDAQGWGFRADKGRGSETSNLVKSLDFGPCPYFSFSPLDYFYLDICGYCKSIIINGKSGGSGSITGEGLNWRHSIQYFCD